MLDDTLGIGAVLMAAGAGGLSDGLLALLLLSEEMIMHRTLLAVFAVAACSPCLAASEELGYPRLAMWWPDSHRQSVADLARYDLIAWGTWEKEETLVELKRRVPAQVHLVSISLTETSFDSWKSRGELMRQIPAEWFLTQCGSRLREPVDAAQTQIPVESIAGQGGKPLFAVGDRLACEYETMRVVGVDAATRTLQVERGDVRPASAHVAGVRIAAHITFWPGTWVMNLSTVCPRVTADPAVGPETWVEWGLRRLLRENVRDGLCVDRVEDGQSWLVPSFGRTIDPDCSNRDLKGDYATFNRAWAEGIRSTYLPRLRDMLRGKPMISNTSGAFADLLNGCIFEAFPGNWSQHPDSYRESWASRAIGDHGLFAAVAHNVPASMSWVETYESQAAPSPDGSRHVPNPFKSPGFVPNYRRMRWGLTTALVAGALFSYEMHTEGHGSLGLMWFDEYDNAGQGRHYLGLPTGPAIVVTDLEAAGRVYRRDFQNGIVVCNPSDREVTVPLGGSFRLIKGVQVPDVNSGQTVASVTIGPMDGRILLR